MNLSTTITLLALAGAVYNHIVHGENIVVAGASQNNQEDGTSELRGKRRLVTQCFFSERLRMFLVN